MKAQLLFERKLKVVRKEPLGHRTPTGVHVYSDRGTCVPRPRCDDFFKAMATEDGPMLAKDECRKVCGGGRLWSRQRCNG